MEFLAVIGQAVKSFIDIFGVTILVPIVIFILSLALRVPVKKAFRAAIFMAIGLTAFNLILNTLWGQMNTVMVLISNNVGRTFDVVDIGWPAAAAIVYSNDLGISYFIVGLVWNLILFFTKVTDTFQPTDIWNYYYFVVWGIMVQFVTGSFVIGLLACMFMNLIVLFIADFLAPALQEYYGYEGLTCTCVCVTNIAILAGLIRWLINKLHIKEVQLNPEKIQEKLGFLGEPAMIGIIMGLIMGVVAYFPDLTNPSLIAETLGLKIFPFALMLAAMLVIYPTVSGMFVKGLIPVSQSLNARVRSGKINRKAFNIGIDPAVYFGETATLTTGLLLIPILIITAIILPGNRIIPVADIPAMPFMAIGAIAVFKGNILNATITGTIWYSIVHYIAADTAALCTQMAENAGQALPEGATYITSWCVSAIPPCYVVMKAFSAPGALKFILMAVCVVVYVLALWHFKTHRKGWFMFFGASEEYTDQYMNVAAQNA